MTRFRGIQLFLPIFLPAYRTKLRSRIVYRLATPGTTFKKSRPAHDAIDLVRLVVGEIPTRRTEPELLFDTLRHFSFVFCLQHTPHPFQSVLPYPCRSVIPRFQSVLMDTSEERETKVCKDDTTVSDISDQLPQNRCTTSPHLSRRIDQAGTAASSFTREVAALVLSFRI